MKVLLSLAISLFIFRDYYILATRVLGQNPAGAQILLIELTVCF